MDIICHLDFDILAIYADLRFHAWNIASCYDRIWLSTEYKMHQPWSQINHQADSYIDMNLSHLIAH